MKKTLTAVAVLGAFAGSALADVTLYGVIDQGLQYQRIDDGTETTNNWGMKSGGNEASQIGLKGSEKISDNLTVGFKLEKSFNADDGSDDNAHFFDRESTLFVQTQYGRLTVGRDGSLDSGDGSSGLLDGSSTGLGGGWGSNIANIGNSFLGYSSQTNNTITYKTPEMAGLTFHAQAALGDTFEDAHEASSSVDRYYGAALTYMAGDFGAGLIASIRDEGNGTDKNPNQDRADGKVVSAYANYDFGFMKAFAAAQYFKDIYTEAFVTLDYIKGYGASLAVSAPMFGGDLTGGVHYGEAEVTEGSGEQKTLGVGAFYEYPLSKSTSLYATAGYNKTSYSNWNKVIDDVTEVEAVFGMTHRF